MNNLNDVQEHLKGFKTIWKCRFVSGRISLDINLIPVNDIKFKEFYGTSSISSMSIRSKSGFTEFNFYAKDITPNAIESEGDKITIDLGQDGKIILMLTQPTL